MKIPAFLANAGIQSGKGARPAYSVTAQTRAGRPVAPSNRGQAANSTAPAGATWSRLQSTSI